MTTQTVELGTNERRQGIALLPLVSGGAAVILAMAAGVGLWTSTRDDVTSVARVEPASSAATAAVTGRGLVAGSVRETGAATAAGEAETVYLVSTPEQAGALQAGIDEAARLAAAVDAPPANERVVLWGTEPAETVLRHSNDMDPTGIRLVDLRSRAAPLNPTFSDQEMYQRWQQAQAAAGPEPVDHPGRD